MTINVEDQEAKTAKEGYVHRVLVAEDQLDNVILDGAPDETMSARSQREAAKGNWLGKFMVWWLDKLQSQHGLKAEAGDLERAEAVEQLEDKSLDVKQ